MTRTESIIKNNETIRSKTDKLHNTNNTDNTNHNSEHNQNRRTADTLGSQSNQGLHLITEEQPREMLSIIEQYHASIKRIIKDTERSHGSVNNMETRVYISEEPKNQTILQTEDAYLREPTRRTSISLLEIKMANWVANQSIVPNTTAKRVLT